MKRWVVLIALGLTGAANGLEQDALEIILEEARVAQKMPGLRAALRTADGTITRAAVGLGDKENEILLDNDIGMPGGSTGKTFVAALTMLLVEDGVLSLDDNASKWLGNNKWFKKLPANEDIKVRHLLSHSAGLGDYPGKVRFISAMVWRVWRQGSAKFEPEELIRYANGRRGKYPVGDGYRYSDIGYLVLGRVIEAASGRDYYDLLEERILGPQRLDQVVPARDSVLKNITPGYQGGVSNLKDDGRMKLDPSSEWTGGGLVTTPTMLVRFIASLANGEIVSAASFELMKESGWRDPKDIGWHYGFGLFVNDRTGVFGHGGSWSGYRTYVSHIPHTGMTIAVQTNRDGNLDLIDVIRKIAAAANQARSNQ